jgi:hypothetical protein
LANGKNGNAAQQQQQQSQQAQQQQQQQQQPKQYQPPLISNTARHERSASDGANDLVDKRQPAQVC